MGKFLYGVGNYVYMCILSIRFFRLLAVVGVNSGAIYMVVIPVYKDELIEYFLR